MRSHYQPPRNKQYFHTKPKVDKRNMETLKKKILRVRQKKIIIYEERVFKG